MANIALSCKDKRFFSYNQNINASDTLNPFKRLGTTIGIQNVRIKMQNWGEPPASHQKTNLYGVMIDFTRCHCHIVTFTHSDKKVAKTQGISDSVHYMLLPGSKTPGRVKGQKIRHKGREM
jgi:hypothetical protein